MNLKDIIKIAAPVVLGPAAGSAISGFLPAAIASNPMISSALVSGIGSLAFGGKPKDALRSALLGGIGGAMSPGQQTIQNANATQGNPILTTGTAQNANKSTCRSDSFTSKHKCSHRYWFCIWQRHSA